MVFKKKMIEAKKAYEKTPSKALEKEIARCNNIQMAKKISLNSAYGAIGNQYFRYYKLANAEAITLSGQVSIRWIENHMNDYLNKILKTEGEDYVIASDTDSIYLNLGDLVNRVYEGREKNASSIVSFLDKVCEMELEKYIDSSYEALAKYVNAYDQKMFMKRENIADRGIWTAKKRYILNVWDSEGVRYEEPKLKMMGIEAVKSSTPAPCRTMIKNALKIMMNGTEDEMIDYTGISTNTFTGCTRGQHGTSNVAHLANVRLDSVRWAQKQNLMPGYKIPDWIRGQNYEELTFTALANVNTKNKIGPQIQLTVYKT